MVDDAPLSRRLTELERLSKLRQDGGLTDEEFADLKARLLTGSANEERETPPDFASAIPIYARRRSGRKVSKNALVVGGSAILLICAVVAAWRFDVLAPQGVAQDFVVTGSNVNLRDDPTSQGSEIVGRARLGETVSGRMATNDAGAEWLHITEGDHRGSYIWAGNVRPMGNPTEDQRPATPVSYSARLSCDYMRQPTMLLLCFSASGYEPDGTLSVTVNNQQESFGEQAMAFDPTFASPVRDFPLGSGEFAIEAESVGPMTLRLQIRSASGDIVASREVSGGYISVSNRDL